MSESLVQFLYLLLRDAVPAGVVEGIVRDVEDGERLGPIGFTNTDLESYARKLVARIEAT